GDKNPASVLRRRWRVGAADRKYRVLHAWLFAGQRFEEGDDVVDFGRRELGAQLRGSHHLDGLVQGPDLAGVEVRRGQGHVAQRGSTEHVLVGGGTRDLETALVSRRQQLRAR